MKLCWLDPATQLLSVAPLAGAWIEMITRGIRLCSKPVAPLAGAWIEMQDVYTAERTMLSLPSRERGLKLKTAFVVRSRRGRSPRGSVD